MENAGVETSRLPHIVALFRTRRALLSASRTDKSLLSVLIPSERKDPVGSPMRVLFTFGDGGYRFDLVGKVVGHRTASRLGPAGIAVAFEGDAKRQAAEMLAFCAGRPLELGTASGHRVESSLRCLCHVNAQRISARVHDVSQGGLFIAAKALAGVKVGAEMKVQLNPGPLGLMGKRLAARVVWRGKKNGEPGFGVRFLDDVNTVRSVVQRYLTPVT